MSTGVVVGVGMLVVCAFITWVGIFVLLDVGIDQNIFDYTDLAERAFGQFGVYNVNIWIALANLGGNKILLLLKICI